MARITLGCRWVGARWVQDSNKLLGSQCAHQGRDKVLHPPTVELSVAQLIVVGVHLGNHHSLLAQLSPHALFTFQARARPMVSVPQTHPALCSSCLAGPVLDDCVEHLGSRAVHLEGGPAPPPKSAFPLAAPAKCLRPLGHAPAPMPVA